MVNIDKFIKFIFIFWVSKLNMARSRRVLKASTRKSRARTSSYNARRRHHILKKTSRSRARLSYRKGNRGRKSSKRSHRKGNKRR
jgi:hypothetical protein